MTDRLFLLDGMALAYRAYYALISRPLVNSKGENTSAVYGFVTALMKILEDERPEYVAVVFDSREPTFRHKRYAAYKATRQKMPEGMASQMERLKEVVRAFNTPLLEVPGFEADDIIGTLALRAEKENVTTYMVTGDKDFMQLISPLTKIYKPGKSGGEAEIIDKQQVIDKFGVPPEQVIEVLGLMGDASDNVPGVPGIGEKTAIPLIQKFGSIPRLYEQIDNIGQEGVRKKLQANKETALLSRELVTIHTDVPLTIDFHSLKASAWDSRELARLFQELEFRTLLPRLRDATPVAASQKAAIQEDVAPKTELGTISTDQQLYHCVTTRNQLQSIVERLGKCGRTAVVACTTGEAPLRSTLLGVSVCMESREAFFIPLRPGRKREMETVAPSIFMTGFHESWNAVEFSREEALVSLKQILEDLSILKVGRDTKHDMLVLKNCGIEFRGIGFDTMVASYVLRPDSRHDLEALVLEKLNYKMMSYEELTGKGKNRRAIEEIPLPDLSRYGAEEADMTLRVAEALSEKLKEAELFGLCTGLEFPLIPVLAGMEFAGVNLDTEYLAGMSKDLELRIDNLIKEIHHFAGQQFNVNSTQQLAEILFDRLKLRTVRKTKTGFSTDAGVLESLRGDHPIVDKLLDYRLLTKLKSTYVDALPQLVNPRTGRLHTSFNQTVAATGRLASNDPNLQNIPIRSEIGRAIRRAFIPGSPDDVLMSADYSQIELRVMAHMCGDPGLTGAFSNGEDIHASTAAKVFGVGLSNVVPEMRRKAKEVNFGIMYGLSPFGLANRLEISQSEAKQIIDNYFLRFPRVKEYIHTTIDTARRLGYVETLLGRRRYLPDITSRNQNVRSNAERQAINMPIQGTAADMIKKAMIAIEMEIRRKGIRGTMLLQVHDELLFEVPRDETGTMEQLVAKEMKNALQLSVPVEVEVGVGKDWLEAH